MQGSLCGELVQDLFSSQTRPLVSILDRTAILLEFSSVHIPEFEGYVSESGCSGQKSGGQEFIGGLDCTVHRNFFGSQVI